MGWTPTPYIACVVRYTARSVDEANLDAADHDICTVGEPNGAVDHVVLPVGLQFCREKTRKNREHNIDKNDCYNSLIFFQLY